MNVVTNIDGPAVAGVLREPRGILAAVHVEPSPGCHLKVHLGSAGLFVRRGELCVAYPLEAILAHAKVVCPELFQPPVAPEAAKREAAKPATA